MKKSFVNYTYIFIILTVCSLVFHISFTDYNDIKYYFPTRTIYIAISLLVNYFYLKIAFNCIEKYIQIDILSIVRVGKKDFLKLLIKRIVIYMIIFILFSLASDLLLYHEICITGIAATLILELVLGIFLAISYNKLKSNTFIITLLVCIVIKLLIKMILYY